MLQKIDAAVHKVERRIVAVAMLIMGVVVALDVLHRVVTRQNGFAARVVRTVLPDSAADLAPTLGTVLTLLLALLAFYAVFRARGVEPKLKALAYGAVTTLACWGALEAYVRLVPNGLIWSQTLGLALMIWAGFVGSSIAARERRHLALDIGPKLFPEKARKYVIALGHLATAAFCVWLLILAVWSVTQHYADWTESNYEGGTFPALPIPKWAAYLAIPYGLGVMALRFLGDMAASLRGQDTGGDEVATFKKMGGLKDDDDASPAPGNGGSAGGAR